jgi:CheY-like chemotaxis protein
LAERSSPFGCGGPAGTILTAATPSLIVVSDGEAHDAVAVTVTARPPTDRPRVLVVEDEPRMAAIIARHLERSGLVVDGIASTGDAALRLVGAGTASAAVVDVMIPHPDGLEVCRHLRHQGWRGPIVVISARADPASERRALAAGADAFPLASSPSGSSTCSAGAQPPSSRDRERAG